MGNERFSSGGLKVQHNSRNFQIIRATMAARMPIDGSPSESTSFVLAGRRTMPRGTTRIAVLDLREFAGGFVLYTLSGHQNKLVDVERFRQKFADPPKEFATEVSR